jgi:hypothetical protein
MANSSATPTEAPPAHDGVHYENPSSKQIDGPVSSAQRDSVQRVVWALFFIIILCVVAMGMVLGIIQQTP